MHIGINREAARPARSTLRTKDAEVLLGVAGIGIGIVHLASWWAT